MPALSGALYIFLRAVLNWFEPALYVVCCPPGQFMGSLAVLPVWPGRGLDGKHFLLFQLKVLPAWAPVYAGCGPLAQLGPVFPTNGWHRGRSGNACTLVQSA